MPNNHTIQKGPKTAIQDPRNERLNEDGTLKGGLLENDAFIINDIGLKIPPEQIHINKQAYNYEWSTLRTLVPRKAKSGHSIARVAIDVVFTQTEDINERLRRLVAGLRATPFCFVYNKYLEQNLLSMEDIQAAQRRAFSRYKAFRPIALALSSMTWSTCGHDGSPECIRGHLEFIWFNYFPFVPLIAFKTGDRFDRPGFAWESELWKKFYAPFMSGSVEWPHRDPNLFSTDINYREFAFVPQGSEQSNAALKDLLDIIRQRPADVQIQLLKLTVGDEGTAGVDRDADSSNYIDVLYNRLARSGFANKELANQLEDNSLTRAGAGLITPILQSLLVAKWSTKVDVPQKGSTIADFRGKNKLLNDIKEATALFEFRAKSARRASEEGRKELDELSNKNFQPLRKEPITIKMPSGGQSLNLGGLIPMFRNKRLQLNPNAGATVEQIIVTFSNVLATIPMIGYRYPTIQHVGSVDMDVTMVINCQNTTAGIINEEYDRIESNALRFKQIPQGFLNVSIKNDFLSLFGINEFITKNIETTTIPGQPGRSRVVMGFSQAGVTSKDILRDSADLENPEQLRQEFIPTSVSDFKFIWHLLKNQYLTEEGTGKISVGTTQKENAIDSIDRFKLKVVNVTKEIDPILFDLASQARDIYNRFLLKAHKKVATGQTIDKSLFFGALNSVNEDDKNFAFVPNYTRFKQALSIVLRARVEKTGRRHAGSALGATIKSEQQLKKEIKRAELKSILQLSNPTELIRQNQEIAAKRKELLDEAGFTQYLTEMRELFQTVLLNYLDHNSFFPLARRREKEGLGKGLMAYPDFRQQLTSVASFAENNEKTNKKGAAISEGTLLKYDPDTYFWYPQYDGGATSAFRLNNVVDSSIIIAAKHLSNNIYETAQGQVDQFFTGTYRKLLRNSTWQGPFDALKRGAGEEAGLAVPFYSNPEGRGTTWENTLRDPDIKSKVKTIKKRIWPDSHQKTQVNRPIADQEITTDSQCTVNTDFTSQWEGISVGSGNPKKNARTTLPETSGKSKPVSITGSLKDRIRLVAPIAIKYAEKNNIDPALILAIINQESSFNPNATSPRNAVGLMQLLSKYFGRHDLTDPNTNIRIGTAEFARLLRRYKGNIEQALSAYNMGAGNLDKFLRAKNKGFTNLTSAEQAVIRRFGKTASPSGDTPMWQYSQYQGKILRNIPRFQRYLKDNFAKANLAQRYVPPKDENKDSASSRIRNIRTQQYSKDVTTTLSSPMAQAINEFSINMIKGQGQSLMRAYPTFKLYFIEDDQRERKRLAFDDFFSYNAVKSIRVVRSRKIAADLCELYLTNISGVLSNRKFKQAKDGGVAPRSDDSRKASEDDNPIVADTQHENPIASLLLQEGVNISLRLGYSSDPGLLTTVFNGVITGIQFSESEDLIRVVAQSHAIELVSDLKGVSKPVNKTSTGIFGWTAWGWTNHAATGPILEEMLSEPEVIHFGRWDANTGQGATPNRDLLTDRFVWRPRPQDDNIFAPPPSKDLERFGSGIAIKDLKYVIYRTTIWDIFQEMTMRHPNFIASPVPYSDQGSERMTMFFGLPNQLYFARHPTASESVPQNRLKRAIKESLDNSIKFVKNISPSAKFGANDILVVENPGEKARAKRLQAERLAKAREAGFIKPFRSYHLFTSTQHIISNNIRANSRDVANTITIKYGEEIEIDKDAKGSDLSGVTIKGEEQNFTIKLDNALPTEDIRTQIGQFINVTHEELAKRYALSMLIQNMKEIYKGNITVLGAPEVKPYDVCYILDEYTDMTGAIEVEEVQHIFDQEHGFRTEIKPDMLVQAAEWSLLSSCEAMGVVMEGVLRKVFGKDSLLHNLGSNRGFAPWPYMLGNSFSLMGGFLANKIINYTQLAQPVVMSPLMHHGRIFAGGVPTRKIPTSIWTTIMGNWHPNAKAGYYNWIEDWKDSLVNSIKTATGSFSQGSNLDGNSVKN